MSSEDKGTYLVCHFNFFVFLYVNTESEHLCSAVAISQVQN